MHTCLAVDQLDFLRYLAFGLRYVSFWLVCLTRGNTYLGALRSYVHPGAWEEDGGKMRVDYSHTSE